MKVLLLDTAFAAVPIHEWLRTLGFEVWTIGNRPYDPLALVAPAYWIKGDYSDVEYVRSLIADHEFDAIIPGCTDVSMDTFVKLGFDKHYRSSIQVDQLLNNKHLFRNLCAELDLPAPKLVAYDALPPSGRFICKPVDSFSGRGVSVFEASDAAAATAAFKQALSQSPTETVICEEFITGQLYSYSAFIDSRKVSVAFSVKEGARYDPFAVDTSHLIEELDKETAVVLSKSVEALAESLSLCDGLLHVQYIHNKSRIAIVEVTRRCPGDLYSKLIEYSTGFPYAARYASYFVGHTVEGLPTKKRHVLRHTIKQTGASSFENLDLSALQNIFKVFPVRRLGEPLEPSSRERTAVAFMAYNNRADLENAYAQLLAIKDR
ncbi:hypothetical protein H4S14_000198 [Agrobacterium vitis]|nr:hypothetical protein [Agrobacterium vitis]MBE1436471.1 hypothetical protein [Agrobacterium vitis]